MGFAQPYASEEDNLCLVFKELDRKVKEVHDESNEEILGAKSVFRMTPEQKERSYLLMNGYIAPEPHILEKIAKQDYK